MSRIFIQKDLDSRDNSLNLLRLLLALLVVFSHAQILAGVGDGVVLFGQHLGSWAVVGFFGISGYLITGARIRSDAGRYLINRVVRIYPAFLLVLVFVAFALAPLTHFLEKGTIDGYFGTSPTPLNYVYSNLLLKVSYYNIGTTLASHELSAWNGSLWSLSYEFWCYIIIGVFMSWKFIRQHIWPTGVLFVISVLAHVGIERLNPYIDNNYDLSLLIFMLPYFLGGAIIYQLRERLPMRGRYALLALVISLILIATFPAYGKQLASPSMAYLILYLGTVLPSPSIIKTHDISYGVYLFHFPVIQFLITLGADRLGFLPLLALSAGITIFLSILSWFGIERAAMRWVRGKAPWGDLAKGPHDLPAQHQS
ncbi:acyltransferase family protein [Schaalia suimastitidis]|uniref:acyltransferase family protein n=1 Tax=Schaalia suimastitidis TaxID=121163 RepID=UPI001F0B1DE9|nr:acyltransferase [Schaalia suimastitidis]